MLFTRPWPKPLREPVSAPERNESERTSPRKGPDGTPMPCWSREGEGERDREREGGREGEGEREGE